MWNLIGWIELAADLPPCKASWVGASHSTCFASSTARIKISHRSSLGTLWRTVALLNIQRIQGSFAPSPKCNRRLSHQRIAGDSVLPMILSLPEFCKPKFSTVPSASLSCSLREFIHSSPPSLLLEIARSKLIAPVLRGPAALSAKRPAQHGGP